MFAGAESISFMRLAYNRIGIAPECLIHVCSGLAFGGNYSEYPQKLSQLMRSNPEGPPSYLIIDYSGHYDKYGDYLDLVDKYVVEDTLLSKDNGLLSLMRLKI